MANQFHWLETRRIRSVDQLRLWAQNPRLDPDAAHTTTTDYAADLIDHEGEKDSLLALMASIVTHGFVPADPIVVWQNADNEKFYVAEGNRRILALKLLRHPDRAPKAIRGRTRKLSKAIAADSIKRVSVAVAPDLDAAEWYINQRHATSGLQRSWSRLQQQRWIARLYDKYNADIGKVIEVTGLSETNLESTLRILKIRDFSIHPTVLAKLNKHEQAEVNSHRLPMTIIERWFTNTVVREQWGIFFDGADVNISSNLSSFFDAYAAWISLVIRRDDPDVPIRINTRTITTELNNILAYLPEVSFANVPQKTLDADADSDEPPTAETNTTEKEPIPQQPKSQVANPNRPRLVPIECQINSSNHKLEALLLEFKEIPPKKYPNCLAASLRVYIDISVAEYIRSEGIQAEIQKIYKRELRDVSLKKRLEYIKANQAISKKSQAVITKFTNPGNEYSLDTLNDYIHGSDTHHTNRQFLNGFWDFLFPLLSSMTDIKYGS